MTDKNEAMLKKNLEVFKREALDEFSIVKKNRHNTHTGEWYGPDPEPQKGAGRNCACPACILLYI